jgi:hypothetical protein
MKNRNVSVVVRGIFFGRLWCGVNSFKDFTINVNKLRERMSDSKLTIVEAIEHEINYNTGDFQDVSIIECSVIMSFEKLEKHHSRQVYTRVSRTIDLKDFPMLRTYYATKKEYAKYEKILDSIYSE